MAYRYFQSQKIMTLILMWGSHQSRLSTNQHIWFRWFGCTQIGGGRIGDCLIIMDISLDLWRSSEKSNTFHFLSRLSIILAIVCKCPQAVAQVFQLRFVYNLIKVGRQHRLSLAHPQDTADQVQIDRRWPQHTTDFSAFIPGHFPQIFHRP